MSDNRSGFTLLEVLISLAIITVILLSLYGSFFLGKKAVDSLDEGPVRLQETRMTLDVMRREVEAALFGRNKMFKIDGRDIYGKDASSITFNTFSLSSPGFLRLTYFIEGKDDHSMVLKKYSVQGNKSTDREIDSEKSIDVLEGIDSFRVEARFGNEWVKTWDSKLSQELPDEVRFTIVVNVNERRYVLSDVARLRIGRTL